MSEFPDRPRRPGRPRKDEAVDTPGMLLEAALELFARNGYGGTSVRAITQAVGLSEGVLYRHFAGKEAIFREVLRQAGSGFFAGQRDLVDPALAATDPAGFLRALAAAITAAWATPRNRLVNSMLVRAVGESHLQVISTFTEAQEQMSTLFARWIEAGLIPADRGTPRQLAWELFAPTAFVRLMYLHADADEATREAGRERVLAHAEFFIARVIAAPADTSDRGGEDG